MMPNNRFHDMQNDGERLRQRKEKLKTHPMSAAEAARLICEVHTHVIDGRVWVDFSAPPDFTKLDGDLYHEAWRVLRRLAGL
jgi:hypothetical protein